MYSYFINLVLAKFGILKMSEQQLTIPQATQMAIQLFQSGRISEADKLCRQILQVDKNNSEILRLLGIIAGKAGVYDNAIELITRAIQLNPNIPDYHNSLGNIFLYQDRLDEALNCYQYALNLGADSAAIYNNVGNIFKKKEEFEQAITYYQHAVKLQAGFKDALCNLTNIYAKLKQFDQAIEYFEKLLPITPPDNAHVYYSYAEALREVGRLTDAILYYQRALDLNPNYIDALIGIAKVKEKQGKFLEQIKYYEQAIEMCDSEKVDIHVNNFSQLSNFLLRAGRVEDALKNTKRFLEIQLSSGNQGYLAFVANYSLHYDRAALFAELQKYNELYAKPLAIHIKPHANVADPHKKLKVGYVSADFRQHSVAYFVESILKNHNHTQFDIFCYYNHEKQDDFTKRFQNYADRWCDCIELSDEELTEQIRQDEIDILVDLSGHIAGNRLLVFARKPAPVQATYIGFPNSTGLTAIDYHITDKYSDPEDIGEKYNSEIPIRMSYSYYNYYPNQDAPDVNSLPAIENGYITFGSFNKFEKITQLTLELWIEILQTMPTAKIVIKHGNLVNTELQKVFLQRLAEYGIEKERVILGSEPSTLATLKAYNQIDISLDTYPYNGATTTCQALWMGIPMVTLVGETHVARAGLSILTAAGFPEFIAYTKEQYIEIAVKLASNIENLQQLRQNMRERLKSSSLMDHVGFTRELENHYRQMWKNWCNQWNY